MASGKTYQALHLATDLGDGAGLIMSQITDHLDLQATIFCTQHVENLGKLSSAASWTQMVYIYFENG